MADEPVAEPVPERLDEFEEEEGGPVKSFLEHLEDLRWVLIKSLVALSVAVLLCLIAGDHVVMILKRPLTHAKISYPGTNQILTALFGTNRLGVFPLAPEVQKVLGLGTNRCVAIQLEPAIVGTNNVLTWRVDNDPVLPHNAQQLHGDLTTLG